MACSHRDLPFESDPDLLHGRDHCWQVALSRRHFRVFSASCRPDTLDYHRKHVPPSTTNILRPAMLTVATGIVVGDFTYLNGIFAAFQLFSSQSMAGLRRRSPQLHCLVVLCQSWLAAASTVPPLAFFGDEHRLPIWCPSALILVCVSATYSPIPCPHPPAMSTGPGPSVTWPN